MGASAQSSWSSVLQNIVSNVQEIVRSEVRLAKTELQEESQAAARASVTLVAGGVLGFYALGFLLLAAVYALTLVLAAWLAAVLVGAVLAAVALIFMTAGWKKLKKSQAKRDTIESAKETVQWVKNQGN